MIHLLILAALLIIWSVVNRISKSTARGQQLWSNIYNWFVPLWILQMILLILPLFEYFNEITLETAAYIIAGHLCVAGGVVLAMKSRQRAGDTIDFSQIAGSRRFFIVIAVIGIGFQCGLSLDRLLASGFSVFDRLNSEVYSELREMQFTSQITGHRIAFLGKLIAPATILSPLCHVAVVYFAFCWGRGERWARSLTFETLLFFGAALLVLFENLVLIGGRLPVAFLIFAGVAGASLGAAFRPGMKRRRTTARKILIAIPILIGLSIVSATLQQFRGNNANPVEQMAVVAAASVSPELRPIAISNQFIGFYLLQLTYLSSSTEVLNFYLNLPNRQMPGPFYGAYSFNVPYQYLMRFAPGFDRDFWIKTRLKLFLPLEQQGRLGNVWPSLFRDLIGDFGRWGALLFLFGFGWVAQRICDVYAERPTPLKAVLVAYIRLIALASGVLSLFYMPFISWILILVSVMLFFQRKRAPKRTLRSPSFHPNAIGGAGRP